MTCAGSDDIVVVIIEGPTVPRSSGRQSVWQAREELFRGSGVGDFELESRG